MTLFYDKLNEIKQKGDSSITIFFKSYTISLELIDTSDETIDLLYNLRKMYRDMFATDFKMTKEKTKKWIKELILESEDRILFIISINKRKIGCIGHGGYNEKENSSQLDNMMKDPSCKISGVMTIVEKIYLKWMFDFFELSKITGYLFSDNEKMMNIHRECGWKLLDKVPIMRKIENECSVWEICKESGNEKIERYFNIIELEKENLLENFQKIEYEIRI